MEWLFMRNTFYGSPFMNLHSGRDMTDRTNTKRLRKSLHNFKYSEDGRRLPQQFKDNEIQMARILLPLAGALVGKFIGDIYCAPRSIYLKGIFAATFTFLLNKVALDFQNYNDVQYWTSNFIHIPKDLQQALKSHDARYTTRWQE